MGRCPGSCYGSLYRSPDLLADGEAGSHSLTSSPKNSSPARPFGPQASRTQHSHIFFNGTTREYVFKMKTLSPVWPLWTTVTVAPGKPGQITLLIYLCDIWQ